MHQCILQQGLGGVTCSVLIRLLTLPHVQQAVLTTSAHLGGSMGCLGVRKLHQIASEIHALALEIHVRGCAPRALCTWAEIVAPSNAPPVLRPRRSSCNGSFQH